MSVKDCYLGINRANGEATARGPWSVSVCASLSRLSRTSAEMLDQRPPKKPPHAEPVHKSGFHLNIICDLGEAKNSLRGLKSVYKLSCEQSLPDSIRRDLVYQVLRFERR